jgi:cytochrome c oxidase assembly protein subunit 15
LLLLTLLAIQTEKQIRADTGASRVVVDSTTRKLLGLASGMLVVQLALGGWVSTNYAVLVCTDFPTCQGSWWPQMRFDEGFQIWRALGMTRDGDNISFPALTAIHYAHRLMAYAVLAVLALLALRLRRVDGLKHMSRWIGGLAALQLASGLGNVVLGWPLIAALGHTGGAAALVLALTWTFSVSCVAPSGVRNMAAMPARSLQ